MAAAEDQILVGRLHQELEHDALEDEAGLMDAGLDGLGEEVVVFGHGEGDLEPDLEFEGLALELTGLSLRITSS